MLVGCMRVSKADGSQVLDLQIDALLGAGVHPHHLYDDRASGPRGANYTCRIAPSAGQ